MKLCNQFNDRNSRFRSVRVALAVLLAKLRLGLSNHVLVCLFHLKSKRTVSRICQQVREALMNEFVLHHIGFQHITREAVLANHQTTLVTDLLTDGPSQAVLVADGTCLYCQKSSNSEFQRRTYSLHKRRHLVKPMIVPASVSIVLNLESHVGSDYQSTNGEERAYPSSHVSIYLKSKSLFHSLVFVCNLECSTTNSRCCPGFATMTFSSWIAVYVTKHAATLL